MTDRTVLCFQGNRLAPFHPGDSYSGEPNPLNLTRHFAINSQVKGASPLRAAP